MVSISLMFQRELNYTMGLASVVYNGITKRTSTLVFTIAGKGLEIFEFQREISLFQELDCRSRLH